MPQSRRAALDGLSRRRAQQRQCRESFFATIERELLARRRFVSQAKARRAVFSFVEGWYNPLRLPSALGYRSPIACEQHMLQGKP